MLPLLDQTLHSVPMLATLGVRTEDIRAGQVTLRLPASDTIVDHAGNLHTGALFAVGELTASTVLGTHPALTTARQLLKSSRVKYYATTHHDVTAHAELTPEALDAVLDALDRDGTAELDIVVQVLDRHGRDVAQLVSHFSLHATPSP